MSSPLQVRNNESDHQFEANVDGGLALVTYHRAGDRITFIHTEVPEASEGKGVASALVKAALAYAREHKMRVVPECSYVAGFVQRYQGEYADLVETSQP